MELESQQASPVPLTESDAHSQAQSHALAIPDFGRIEHVSLVIDGMRLHYGELGPKSDPRPIVLLHGLSDSHLTWKRVAPSLATGRRVLMPDFMGSGLSDRPDATYSLEWHAHMIARFLQRIGVREIDVVGHSFGGGVAQMLLLEPGVTIRRLVLLAAGGLGRDVGMWLRLATLPGIVELFGQPFMRLGTRLTLFGVRDSLPREDLEQMMAMNGLDGTARAFARTVRDVIDWRGQRRMWHERAHEVKRLPEVAVCWGERDEIIPIKHGAEFARSLDGAVFHRFEGAGHYLHHQQPETLVKLLHEFLDRPLPPLPTQAAIVDDAFSARESAAPSLDRKSVALLPRASGEFPRISRVSYPAVVARKLLSTARLRLRRFASPATNWVRKLFSGSSRKPRIPSGPAERTEP